MSTFECPKCHLRVEALATVVSHPCPANQRKSTPLKKLEEAQK